MQEVEEVGMEVEEVGMEVGEGRVAVEGRGVMEGRDQGRLRP